jgi:hypothetical protein
MRAPSQFFAQPAAEGGRLGEKHEIEKRAVAIRQPVLKHGPNTRFAGKGR